MQSTSMNNEMDGKGGLQGRQASVNPNQSAAEAKRVAEQQEMMKNTMLSQILDKSALARLSNLTTVKPEKGKAVENMLIQMARTGQIRGQLNDSDLRKLLDQVSVGTKKATSVKYDRRRAAIDSSEEEEESKGQKDESSDED